MAIAPSPVHEHLNDPITRHMRTDFAAIRMEQTVGEALTEIRALPPEGRIIYFYVIDAENRLQGVVPTRRLLLSPLEEPLESIMIRHVIRLPSTATVLDACEVFMMQRLLALPIVDDEQRLIGVVDVDLYTEERSEIDRSERNDDLFQLIGVHLIDSRKGNAWLSFRDRFPWLLCNIGGGILAAFLSGIFEAELQQVVALALFIPVVLALAESVAIQSVSLCLQMLHGRQPTIAELLQKLRSELLVGIYLGIACALAVGTVAGIVGGVTAAALIGVAMPNLLRLFQREPQVAAGPIALAMTDMITLLIYFGLARNLAPLMLPPAS